MGTDIILKASDGHELSAYLCEPNTDQKGAIVVIQEIFGVNDHIRDITERFALLGYKSIAPALYDRYENKFEVGYTEEDLERGRNLKSTANQNIEGIISDLSATKNAVESAGSVGITGFCWGGFVAWLGACRLNFQAASCYYGGGIVDFIEETPKCPAILHFGSQDKSIPMVDVEKISSAQSQSKVYVYEADHGFHCNMRSQFDPRASSVSAMRTIRLFDKYLAT